MVKNRNEVSAPLVSGLITRSDQLADFDFHADHRQAVSSVAFNLRANVSKLLIALLMQFGINSFRNKYF